MPEDKDMKEKREELSVFKNEKDLPHLLKQIVVDIHDEANKKIYNNWNVSYKDIKNCNVKLLFDNEVQLEVCELYGGFQIGEEDPRELAARAKDTRKLMANFVKDLKKRFKEKSGKNLGFKQLSEKVNFELIATNGLYRFYCIKRVKVSTKLEGQDWSEDE